VRHLRNRTRNRRARGQNVRHGQREWAENRRRIGEWKVESRSRPEDGASTLSKIMYSIIHFMIKRNSIKFIVKENCIQDLSSFFQNVFNIMFICFFRNVNRFIKIIFVQFIISVSPKGMLKNI